MGKPPRKNASPAPVSGAPGGKNIPLIVAVIAVAAVVIAGFGFMLSDRTTDAASTPSTAAPIAAAAPGADAVPAALLKPHPQKDLPPLELPAYPVGRSPEVITAAYKFAAEHPEVLSFVPCFCGCERSGHRGNEDCFVKTRSATGDVTQWEPHGMECNVCVDVATQAMQMYRSGASVRDIRAAVEQKWATQSAQMHTHTPTPEPPK